MDIDYIINLLEPTKNTKNEIKTENLNAVFQRLKVYSEFPFHIYFEFPVHILVRISSVRSLALGNVPYTTLCVLQINKFVNRHSAIDHNEFVSS